MDKTTGDAVAHLIKRLEFFCPLADDDRKAIYALESFGHFHIANVDIERQGNRPNTVHLISDGFACCYKQGRRGERQVTSVLLPGDICNANMIEVAEMDHSIGTLSECQTLSISGERLSRLKDSPRVARALRLLELSEASRSRELIYNIGARKALAKVAHLFCEMHYRMVQIGEADGGVFKMPITQKNLSEIVGLSVVHVNRAISELKKSHLISIKNRYLEILNISALHEKAEFTTGYLNLAPSSDFKV